MSIQITISCTDHGSPPLTSNRTVHVLVLDVNDHAPLVISEDPIRLTINETDMSRDPPTLVSTPLTRVVAKDPDEGNNGTLVYSLMVTDLDMLALNIDQSGVVWSAVMWDYERRDSYQCLVIVRDQGSPPRYAVFLSRKN